MKKEKKKKNWRRRRRRSGGGRAREKRVPGTRNGVLAHDAGEPEESTLGPRRGHAGHRRRRGEERAQMETCVRPRCAGGTKRIPRALSAVNAAHVVTHPLRGFVAALRRAAADVPLPGARCGRDTSRPLLSGLLAALSPPGSASFFRVHLVLSRVPSAGLAVRSRSGVSHVLRALSRSCSLSRVVSVLAIPSPVKIRCRFDGRGVGGRWCGGSGSGRQG